MVSGFNGILTTSPYRFVILYINDYVLILISYIVYIIVDEQTTVCSMTDKQPEHDGNELIIDTPSTKALHRPQLIPLFILYYVHK